MTDPRKPGSSARAEHLAAARARNEFGYTAWGVDWLRLAEPTSVTRPEPLLPRARSIARNSGVRTTITERQARATIHRGAEASVAFVEFAPLSRDVTCAIRKLAGDAPDHALTDDVHARLVADGHSPAPTLVAADCSCRARTARCLHVLAMLYDLVRRVDEHPSTALTLQGFGAATVDVAEADAAETAPPRWTPLTEIDPRRFYTSGVS